MDLTTLALLVLVTLGGSYIQSVTGFGFGIFVMMFFPALLQYTEANVLSSMLGMLTSVVLAVQLRRQIHWKNTVFPLLGCLLATYAAVDFVKRQASDTLLLLLGAVLLCLSLYFLFFSHKVRIRSTWYTGLAAGALSGIMGGMFSMGGPPVVIYFLQSEEDSDHYLAAISAYFVGSNVITITAKAAAGFITPHVWTAFAVGLAGMGLGALIGRWTRAKVRPDMIRRMVYGFMAISGVLYMVTAAM